MLTQKTVVEMHADKQSRATAMYGELRRESKEWLLSEVNRLRRVHGLTLRDTKSDLIHSIVDAKVWGV